MFRLASTCFTLSMMAGSALLFSGFFLMVVTGYGVGFWAGVCAMFTGVTICWLSLSAKHLLRWWPGRQDA
ncbi:MAG: hypothetical protein ABW063_00895 [Caulobacter sp.]